MQLVACSYVRETVASERLSSAAMSEIRSSATNTVRPMEVLDNTSSAANTVRPMEVLGNARIYGGFTLVVY